MSNINVSRSLRSLLHASRIVALSSNNIYIPECVDIGDCSFEARYVSI